MKKFLQFLLGLVIVLALALIVLVIIAPNQVTVTRSILIKAPKEVVFEQLSKFKNWPNWSPFYELDTTAKYAYSGEDGTEGSSFTWDSKKDDVGAGAMMNTGVKGTHFDYHLDVLKPYTNGATGYLQATDSAGMTKATWTFSCPVSFPANVMQVLPFMNMEKMLGNTFEHGLEKLKGYVESHPSELSPGIEISEVDYPEHIFLGARKAVSKTDIVAFCGSTYDLVKKGASDKITGPAIGIYYTWDGSPNTDMFAGYPVSDTTVHADSATFATAGPSKAYMATLKGGYGREPLVHMALGKHCAAKGKTNPLVLEEYVAGPKNEPDSNKWVTNIYYLVK